jgi:hypothetical protein
VIDVRPGLCASCQHARTVSSAKGSTFWLCRKSESDARFPKYPRLPVLRCAGYERAGSAEDQRGGGGHADEVDQHDRERPDHMAE